MKILRGYNMVLNWKLLLSISLLLGQLAFGAQMEISGFSEAITTESYMEVSDHEIDTSFDDVSLSEAMHSRNLELIESLLEAGVSIDKPQAGKNGSYATHFELALLMADEEMCMLMIPYIKDIQAHDALLSLICGMESEELLHSLFEIYGSSITTQMYMQQVLDLIDEGDTEMLHLFLQYANIPGVHKESGEFQVLSSLIEAQQFDYIIPFLLMALPCDDHLAEQKIVRKILELPKVLSVPILTDIADLLKIRIDQVYQIMMWENISKQPQLVRHKNIKKIPVPARITLLQDPVIKGYRVAVASNNGSNLITRLFAANDHEKLIKIAQYATFTLDERTLDFIIRTMDSNNTLKVYLTQYMNNPKFQEDFLELVLYGISEDPDKEDSAIRNDKKRLLKKAVEDYHFSPSEAVLKEFRQCGL